MLSTKQVMCKNTILQHLKVLIPGSSFGIPLPTGIASMAATPSTGWRQGKPVRKDKRRHKRKNVRRSSRTCSFVLFLKNLFVSL